MNPEPVYVVCDRCGFFYGDVRLVGGKIKCPDCGHEAAWAFPSITKALAYQAQVWEAMSG